MNTPDNIEFITCQPTGSWLCICKNEPEHEGFYPCDEKGNYTDDDPPPGTTAYFHCDRCGRIINADTLFVIGKTGRGTLHDKENVKNKAMQFHSKYKWLIPSIIQHIESDAADPFESAWEQVGRCYNGHDWQKMADIIKILTDTLSEQMIKDRATFTMLFAEEILLFTSASLQTFADKLTDKKMATAIETLIGLY
jgi:hypothetical protein